MILIINNLIEIFILKGNNSIFNNIYHIYSIFQFDVLKVTDQCYLIDSFSAKDKFYCFNKCNIQIALFSLAYIMNANFIQKKP